jgi:hypothetical protein
VPAVTKEKREWQAICNVCIVSHSHYFVAPNRVEMNAVIFRPGRRAWYCCRNETVSSTSARSKDEEIRGGGGAANTETYTVRSINIISPLAVLWSSSLSQGVFLMCAVFALVCLLPANQWRRQNIRFVPDYFTFSSGHSQGDHFPPRPKGGTTLFW